MRPFAPATRWCLQPNTHQWAKTGLRSTPSRAFFVASSWRSSLAFATKAPSSAPFVPPPSTHAPSSAAEARSAARIIRSAILQHQWAHAFHIHNSVPVPSRLVTSAMVHSLLRVGRRFKAAEVAELAFLEGGVKLNYKTSEAIILSLCPTDTLQWPRWKLTAAPGEIGANAAKDMGWRRDVAKQEIQFEGEREVSAYTTHLRNRLQKDGVADLPETLDRATYRAILFMRAARQARQHQTRQMWQALVDACLLQGEIVIATLLVVLMIRQWQARKTLLQIRAEIEGSSDENTQPLQPEALINSAQAVALPAAESIPERGALSSFISTSGSRVAPVVGAFDGTPLTYHQTDPPSLDPLPPKPKLRPKLDVDFAAPDPGISRDDSLLQTIITAISYPADGHSPNSYSAAYTPQPEYANPRYPRPLLQASISAFKSLVEAVDQDRWESLPPSLLRLILDFPAHIQRPVTNTSLAAPQDEDLPQFAHDHLGSAIARLTENPTLSKSLDHDDWNNLLWAAYFNFHSRPVASSVLGAMEKAGLSMDHEKTMATMLSGSISLEDWEGANTIIRRILDLYEAGEVPIDPRIPFLLYTAMAEEDPSGDSFETLALAHALGDQLEKDGDICDQIPRGEPVLLNAVLKYFLATNRSKVVQKKVYPLLVFYAEDKKFVRRGVMDLAASFGPEFYNLLLLNMYADRALQAIGKAESVWRIARRAEIHSWRLALQHRKRRRSSKHQIKPWFRGLSSWKTVLATYSYAMTGRVGTGRPGLWNITHPLDSAVAFRITEHEAPQEEVPAEMAQKRAFELHEAFLSEHETSTALLQEIWRRLEYQDTRRGVSETSPATHSTTVRVCPSPDAEYWQLLLQDSSPRGLDALVPLRQPDDPSVWPILVQTGASLMKIVPFELGDAEDEVTRQILLDMYDVGWCLGRQLPLTADERAAWDETAESSSLESCLAHNTVST